MNGRNPLSQSHTLPGLCFQPPDCLTTSTPPPPLPTFPSFSTVSLAGARGSFQTPLSHLKVHREGFCGGRRRGRNMDGEGWWEPVNHDHDAEGLRHPREGAEGGEMHLCKVLWNCPQSLGTHREAVGACSGWEGWDISRLSHALVQSLSAQRVKKGVRKTQGDDWQHDGRKDDGRMLPWHTQDEQPDLEFLSDSVLHGRNAGC